MVRSEPLRTLHTGIFHRKRFGTTIAPVAMPTTVGPRTLASSNSRSSLRRQQGRCATERRIYGQWPARGPRQFLAGHVHQYRLVRARDVIADPGRTDRVFV